MRLKDKVALVTGAGRGIGRGIAEVFAEEGAHVAINFVENPGQAQEVAEWVRARGRRAMTVEADVSVRTQVEPMVDRVWNVFPQPHFTVAVAYSGWISVFTRASRVRG